MSHGIVASSGGHVIRVLPLVSGTPDTASLLSVLHLVTTQNKTYIHCWLVSFIATSLLFTLPTT